MFVLTEVIETMSTKITRSAGQYNHFYKNNTYYANQHELVDSVTKLFQTVGKPMHMDALRKALPRNKDLLLDEIIQRENKIVESKKVGSHDLEKTLVQDSKKVQYIVYNPENNQQMRVAFWKDSPHQHRVVMDHSNWKINNILLKQLNSQDSSKWTQVTTNIKTCTSVLTNQDATFCGNDGALIYLAPQSQEALILASPHDVDSPSETHTGSGFYHSARSTVEHYLVDQEKFHIAYDAVRALKKTLQDHLNNLQGAKNYKSAKMLLEKTFSTPFEKKYYTENAEKTDLESEISNLIGVLKLIPELSKVLDVKDLAKLSKTINAYVHKDEVIKRGTQRQETTGWELNPSKEEGADHVLGINQRKNASEIGKLTKELERRQVFNGEYESIIGDDLDEKKLIEFAESHKDHFFKNISINTITNYTVTQAVSFHKQYKKEAEHEQIRSRVSIENSENSFLSVAKKSELNNKNKKADINELHKVINISLDLDGNIKKIEKIAKSSYTEIQFYSNHLRISGIGLKAKAVEQLSKPSFSARYQRHMQLSKKLAHYEALLKTLKEKMDNIHGATALMSKHRAVIGEEYKKLEGKIKQLTESLKETDTEVTTYRLMRKAQELNIPCFIHTGPEENFPALQ